MEQLNGFFDIRPNNEQGVEQTWEIAQEGKDQVDPKMNVESCFAGYTYRWNKEGKQTKKNLHVDSYLKYSMRAGELLI